MFPDARYPVSVFPVENLFFLHIIDFTIKSKPSFNAIGNTYTHYTASIIATTAPY